MKKLIFSIALMMVVASIFSFKEIPHSKPKLYPEIEKYYAGLHSSKTSDENHEGISYLSSYIRQATLTDQKIELAFTCPDNSFRSVAAQIILQSLLSVNKYGKLNVTSCGFQTGEISPMLITILTKHGFQVSPSPGGNNGSKSYEIKFGEGLSSLNVYAKPAADPSIPKSNFLQIKICSDRESNCSDLPGAKFRQGFSISPSPTATTEEYADKQFTEIATVILIAFDKATD